MPYREAVVQLSIVLCLLSPLPAVFAAPRPAIPQIHQADQAPQRIQHFVALQPGHHLPRWVAREKLLLSGDLGQTMVEIENQALRMSHASHRDRATARNVKLAKRVGDEADARTCIYSLKLRHND